jgi:hypothetical protein
MKDLTAFINSIAFFKAFKFNYEEKYLIFFVFVKDKISHHFTTIIMIKNVFPLILIKKLIDLEYLPYLSHFFISYPSDFSMIYP